MSEPATIEQAFDYRGDVTVTLTSGEAVEGYAYDRREHEGRAELRMLLPDGTRRTLPAAQITRIDLTGRDPAAGKSWETWVQRYKERKLAERGTG